MSPLRVRPADDADREPRLALRRELWPSCSEERHRLEIEQHDSQGGVALVAEDGEAGLVGFAEVSIRREHVEGTATSPVAYLEGWFVRQPFRARGIGRLLMVEAEHWAREKGFTELASDAELDNPGSQRAHAKLGFEEVGRTVHYVKKLPRGRKAGKHLLPRDESR